MFFWNSSVYFFCLFIYLLSLFIYISDLFISNEKFKQFSKSYHLQFYGLWFPVKKCNRGSYTAKKQRVRELPSVR